MNSSLYTVLGLTALSFSKSMGSVGRTTKLFIKEYPLALFKRSFVADNSSGFLYDDIKSHKKKIERILLL